MIEAIVLAAATGCSIYVCTDRSGRKHTSDRPIAACEGMPQYSVRSDGSSCGEVSRPLTEDERFKQEEDRRKEEAEKQRCRIEERRDQGLLKLFPSKAAHDQARAKALDDVRENMRRTQSRLDLLETEHKRWLDEAEFYLGKQMPDKLRRDIDANEASLKALKSTVANQEAESSRINGFYNEQLADLQKLWLHGAPQSARCASKT